MSKIHQLNDPSVLRAPSPRRKEPSERTIEAQALRALIRDLNDPDQVFEIELVEGEKPATVRQRLMNAAAREHKEIAVRRYGRGFAVGLMTPERRSNRGRPRTRPSQ